MCLSQYVMYVNLLLQSTQYIKLHLQIVPLRKLTIFTFACLLKKKKKKKNKKNTHWILTFLLNLISNYCQWSAKIKNIYAYIYLTFPVYKKQKEKRTSRKRIWYQGELSIECFGTCMTRCLLNDVPWLSIYLINLLFVT